MIKKKQKNKKTGQTRVVERMEKEKSFFNFFGSVDCRDAHLDTLEDEEADELENQMQEDLEVSDILKDEAIPFSLEYYLGLNEKEGDEDLDDEDDDDEDDEDFLDSPVTPAPTASTSTTTTATTVFSGSNASSTRPTGGDPLDSIFTAAAPRQHRPTHGRANAVSDEGGGLSRVAGCVGPMASRCLPANTKPALLDTPGQKQKGRWPSRPASLCSIELRLSD